MANKITNTDHYAAIANAIRRKNGETDTYTPAEMADAIGRIPKGVVEENDVIFIDYDGTIVKSYTASEFQNLQILPSNPNHIDEGLIGQGWNWALADAKEYVSKYGMLEIGQMYITSDGNTHLFIHISEEWPNYTISLFFNHIDNQSGRTIIDWGDGTPTEEYGGSVSANHEYLTTGDYEITLETVAGTITISYAGSGAAASHLLGSNAQGLCALRKVFIGNNVQIGNHAFGYMRKLEAVTIPQYIDNLSGSKIFASCKSLTSLTIPNQVTTISDICYSSHVKYVSLPPSITSITGSVFRYCDNLLRISFPENVPSIPSYFAQECYNLIRISGDLNFSEIPANAFTSVPAGNIIMRDRVEVIRQNAFNLTGLTKVTIPQNVTTIEQNAFASCYFVIEYHLKPLTPPSIKSTTFSGSLTETKFYVPSGSVNAYKTASYWSSYSSRIFAEPE